MHSKIGNFLENLNLNPEIYTDEVRINLIKYLRNFKYNLELKIGAAIFHVLSCHEIPFPINKIEKLVCMSSIDKKIIQVNSSFLPKFYNTKWCF